MWASTQLISHSSVPSASNRWDRAWGPGQSNPDLKDPKRGARFEALRLLMFLVGPAVDWRFETEMDSEIDEYALSPQVGFPCVNTMV